MLCYHYQRIFSVPSFPFLVPFFTPPQSLSPLLTRPVCTFPASPPYILSYSISLLIRGVAEKERTHHDVIKDCVFGIVVGVAMILGSLSISHTDYIFLLIYNQLIAKM